MAITTINNRAINRADTAASGQLWTATSATASDFQAAAAGGKIAQVTTGTNNGYDTTSNATSNTDVLSASGTTWETAITPSATSSKILILPAAVSGGAMTLLETQTASSSATLSFTDNIDSTYDEYVFKFYHTPPKNKQH